MPANVELARRDGVELVRTGSWPAMTGSWTPSREDLASAVKALECPAVRRPVLKVGHLDDRFTPAKVGDGEPAIGWVDNLRLGDGGHTLIGDYAGMPAWIGQIMASAWPDRSIEGDYNYRCTLGHTHAFALKAVALLGVTPPAVGTLKSLQDVAELYGVNVAASDQGTGEHVEVTIRGDAEPPLQVPNVLVPVRAASDEKLRAYWVHGKGALKIRWGQPHDFDRCVAELDKYVTDPKGLCAEYHHEALGAWPGREHVKAAEGKDEQPMSRAQQIRDAWNASNPPYSQWVVEARPDAAIVVDDVDRSYRLYPVTWDGDEPVFGQPQQHDPAAEKVLVFASRAESRPEPDVTAAAKVSDTAWDPKPGDYTPAQWKTACLLDTGQGDPDLKDRYSLPVRDPDGTLNRAAVHAAATRLEQVKADPDVKKAAAAKLLALYKQLGEDPPPALRFAATKKVAASTPDLPAAEPESPNTDPKEDLVSTDLSGLRSRLGLPDDADEQAMLAALDELKAKADTPTQPTPEMVAASAAVEAEKTELQTAFDKLTARMEEISGELAAVKAEKLATVKASVIGTAVKDGKIKPADRERWEADYDEAPNVTTRILASIAPGTAVPVMASGTVGSPEPTGADITEDELSAMFFGPNFKPETQEA